MRLVESIMDKDSEQKEEWRYQVTNHYSYRVLYTQSCHFAVNICQLCHVHTLINDIIFSENLPIMLTLCLMILHTYYAHFNAGIICADCDQKPNYYAMLHCSKNLPIMLYKCPYYAQTIQSRVHNWRCIYPNLPFSH